MSDSMRSVLAFGIMALLLVAVGVIQSWSLSLTILNLCIISAVMSLGVNIQWGFAGLFNAGIMGFAALGGVTAVILSVSPVGAAWSAGGFGIVGAFFVVLAAVAGVIMVQRYFHDQSRSRLLITTAFLLFAFIIYRMVLDPAVEAIEAVEPAKTGFLGGFGLPIVLSWGVAAFVAAGVAWIIGKIALGLRSDYLAIATLGISEIIVSVLKNEDWLTRGVKNVNGLPRPVPYEIDIQESEFYRDIATSIGIPIVDLSSIIVKLSYTCLFLIVLVIVFLLAERAVRSPWGRMMRAIRDNEVSSSAMGKNITARHLQVFVLGSAVIGIAGAMLTTLDGQFTPGSYQPLRFTFLIWIMVIVGGSGNNLGSILGGFVVWFIWIEAEPIGQQVMNLITSNMADGSAIKAQLVESASHIRLIMMGVILLLVLRFRPQGMLPESRSQ